MRLCLQIPCRYIKKWILALQRSRPEEMQGVPHYLVDVLEPEEEFHVVKFQQMAKEAMEEIYEKGKIPILVRRNRILYSGGDQYDIDFTEAEQENCLPCRSWRNWPKQKVLSIFMKG